MSSQQRLEWSEQQTREILDLLHVKFNHGLPDHWISFALLPNPDGNGNAYALSITDDELPGSAIIEITDEKLLAKLRSIKGQITYHGLPGYYYEYLMSTADFKVFSKTGQLRIAIKKVLAEQLRLGEEIMQFLIKRETSLADALDALTMVMLNALGAKYGQREEFSRFSEQVSRFLGSTERDLAVGWVPKKQPGGLAAKLTGFFGKITGKSDSQVQPRTVTMVEERPERVRRLAIEVGEVISNFGPKSLGDSLDSLNSTMLTAIKATCGRERANEFELLLVTFKQPSAIFFSTPFSRVPSR